MKILFWVGDVRFRDALLFFPIEARVACAAGLSKGIDMLRKLTFAAATAAMLAVPVVAGAFTGSDATPRSITLFNDEALKGTPVKITADTPNLQTVTAPEGFDGTANDYAYSIRTEGRWQVCMDAGYKTDCREVDGEVATLGEHGGSVSSVRYLGPSAVAAKGGAAAPKTAAVTGPMSQPAAPAWQPMRNVDLFGNDYREIVYGEPGNGWEQCKAACDGDRKCKAFTWVAPGRQPHGECFLKDKVPEASASECCVSGVKGAPSAGNARGDAAISRVMGRLGQRAGDAAERKVGDKVEEGIGKAIDRIF